MRADLLCIQLAPGFQVSDNAHPYLRRRARMKDEPQGRAKCGAATGYQEVRPREASQSYLEVVVRKELAAWARRFPDEFYKNIYILRGWVWPGMGEKRYSVVARYTTDLIYDRLAPSLLNELESKAPKNKKGQRSPKLHQWLTEDIGDPTLTQHIHTVIMFQRMAISSGHGWNHFVKSIDRVMPRRGRTIERPLDEPED